MQDLGTDQQKAAEELLKREEASESLLAFSSYTFDEFKAGPHHQAICEKLEAVERGDCRRLIICLPPRYSKSELVSRRFPAWYFGRNPNKFIIFGTYGQDLSNDFGRDVRQIFSSPEYGRVFEGIRLDPTAAAVDHWRIENKRGRYIAAGVGTAVTGRGAHLFIIDDPFKGPEDAYSVQMRERAYTWYKDVVFTRLQPQASIVICATRWHDDDLIGRIMDASKEDTRIRDWDILRLPVRAELDDPLGREPGAVLWPEWYSEEDVLEQEAVLGERSFMALYQQSPIREEGDYFHADWFQSYTTLPDPKMMRFYGASDYATDDSSRDWTVHGVFGLDAHANIYVVDWYRERAKSLDWIEAQLDLIEKWDIAKWFEEKGAILNMADPLIRKRMRERDVFCSREAFNMSRRKEERALSIQGRAQQGMVHLPADKSWTKYLLYELTRFPAGAHDDQVDVFTLLGRGLGQLRPGRRRPKGPKPVIRAGYSFKDLLARHKRRVKGFSPAKGAPIMGEHNPFDEAMSDEL